MRTLRFLPTFFSCAGLAITLVAAPVAQAADVLNFAPSAPSKTTQKALTEARSDFDAVVQGRLPRYAKKENAALPADGGSDFYKGRGYSLTIVKQLSRLGDVDGYLYGPVLTFEPTLISGNGDTLSDVRFYSSPALQKLMKPKQTG